MKKFFTSLFLMGTVAAMSAQNFRVTGVDDAVISDGDVFTIGYVAAGRPGYCAWDPELVVHVDKASSALTGKSAFTITATASVPDVVQYCGLNNQCMMLGAESMSKSAIFGPGAVIPLQIDIASAKLADFTPVDVKVTVTDGSQTTDFTVRFEAVDQAGIDSPEAAGDAVSVQGRTLHYSLSAPENITLFNISGRAVLSRSLSGIGTISLQGLPAGVYVYRLGHEAGKLLVR